MLGTYLQEDRQLQRAVAKHQKLVRINEAHPRMPVAELVDADVVDLQTPRAAVPRCVQLS